MFSFHQLKRGGVFKRFLALGAAIGLAGLTVAPQITAAHAEGLEDPTLAPYFEAFKGKKIGYVPFSMSFDLAQGWLAGMQKQADELGYEIIVRDPNWNTDVGSQAMNQLINEKPDIIVYMNPDLQSYAKILKKAKAAGIQLVAVNLKSVVPTHYIGEDWQLNGAAEAEYIVSKCGEGTGRSGKVAILQGILTSAASAYQLKGVSDVFAEHPEIEVVSNQSANWDAGKAHEITQTVLQQHPDLCGVVGFWDGMDIGAGAAVKEANLAEPVYVVTSGGGAKEAACDKLLDGTYSAYMSYDVRTMAHDINTVIKILLQSKPPVDMPAFSLPTDMVVLTKDNLKPDSCWVMDDFK
ncbi:sugar ABC transporter substrate-binding protein [Martelella mediterranea]|uniref:D-ribose-binding periplasmic protein n=1 Tax=Martelella mediterranea DSM 17316 TaxID=1122214 RepID=A0A1U9Z326_9HYPH|nr:sugar ABC transporter substrate-binding protein [Martelella mediterranea]AQZ52103.1 D-ribose-binding periplasmic protein precursor [Martelella mediterranea DSM 17316]